MMHATKGEGANPVDRMKRTRDFHQGRQGIRLRFDHRWTSHAVPFPKHSPLLPPPRSGIPGELWIKAFSPGHSLGGVGMGAPVAGQVCALLRSHGERGCLRFGDIK